MKLYETRHAPLSAIFFEILFYFYLSFEIHDIDIDLRKR